MCSGSAFAHGPRGSSESFVLKGTNLDRSWRATEQWSPVLRWKKRSLRSSSRETAPNPLRASLASQQSDFRSGANGQNPVLCVASQTDECQGSSPPALSVTHTRTHTPQSSLVIQPALLSKKFSRARRCLSTDCVHPSLM